jgi:hypothetical protein
MREDARHDGPGAFVRNQDLSDHYYLLATLLAEAVPS